MRLNPAFQPASSNLSLTDSWLEASMAARKGSDPRMPAIMEPTAHTQFEAIIEDSYDVAVHVGFSEHSPLQFRHPTLLLHVSDADQDGVFVVTDTFSRVYGEGHDPETAIGDYLESLLARFQDLEESEDILAVGLCRELENMRRYIARAK